MAVAGADTLQFEATAEVRAKIFKQTVVELHGGEFWATWCRPKKAKVSLPCCYFVSASDLQCHVVVQILKQFKKKVQNN